MRLSELSGLGVEPDLVARWSREFEALTDVQEQAIRAGLLTDSNNLLIAAPTSSGKTFIGEMAAAVGAHAGRRHAIFAVPFKALADEHYERLRERYADYLSVVISDGDWSEFDDDIRRGNYGLAVATYEKLHALMVQTPGLIDQLSVLVVDEVQLLGDATRGPGLELMLTRVLSQPSAPRIVALSASLDDLGPLAHWLRATPVVSQHRPVPLTECVADPSGLAVTVDNAEVRRFPPAPDREALLDGICRALVAEGSQVLIFRSTVRPTRETAERLVGKLPATGLSEALGRQLSLIEDPEAQVALQRCLSSGVAFHNADLAPQERRVVESAFRDGAARVLVSTTTLAMGVNLPTDWVVIADSTRWTLRGAVDIGVAEYKNAAGRAGRLGQRTAGHSVLLSDSVPERRQLLQSYVSGAPEPIESQLPRHPVEDTVFYLVCAGLATSQEGFVEYLTRTLAYETFWEPHGDGVAVVRQAVADALQKCIDSGLVTSSGGMFLPTEEAKHFSQAGLCLATAITLVHALRLAESDGSDNDILFLVAGCKEAGDHPWPTRKFGQAIDPRPGLTLEKTTHIPDGPVSGVLARPVITDREKAAVVRFACLLDWIAGVPTRAIGKAYAGAAPVRVRSLGANGAWLLTAMMRAAQFSHASQLMLQRLAKLEASSRYGVPAELTGLARLRVPGIGREALLPLLAQVAGFGLLDPDSFLTADDSAFSGVLTAAQVARLKDAIESDTTASLERRRTGQVARAEAVALPDKVIADLYSLDGIALERAVCDALTHLGLGATRLQNQAHGEEDLRLVHQTGTVVISVTASEATGKPIKWTKARAVLGQGAGLNPINYVCIGRPRFEALAVRHASEIGQETGGRSILLLTIPAFSELVLRCVEGIATASEVCDFLATRSGSVDLGDLGEAETTGRNEQ